MRTVNRRGAEAQRNWKEEQLRIPLGFYFRKPAGAAPEFPPSPERARWWFERMHAEVEKVVKR